VLLFRGADKTLRNKSIQDAFQAAHSAGHTGIADVIRRFTASEVGLYYSANESFSLFTARCYASAVLAMGLCLSVRLSVTSRCSIETAERIELVFGM